MAAEEGDLVLIPADVLGNGLVIQCQLGDPGHVIQASVVAAGVPAVGVGKMGFFKAQFLGDPVHFADKGRYRIGGLQTAVFCDLPACCCGKHHGRIVSAGQHHGFHHRLDIHLLAPAQVGNGRTGVYQTQLISHRHHIVGIQIKQRHIGRKELGNAGGVQFGAFPGIGIEDLIVGGIENQQLIKIHPL